MIRLIAEYRIKKGTSDIVQSAIQNFVTAVHQAEPDTEYTSYQVGDTNRFIHMMAFVDSESQKRHQNAAYTLEFVEILYPNCEETPTFTPINIIS